MKRINNYLRSSWRVLNLICLSLIVISCANAPLLPPTTTHVKTCPDSSVTQRITYSEYTGTTWEHLELYVYDLLDVIDEHNKDKQIIREYCDGDSKTTSEGG